MNRTITEKELKETFEPSLNDVCNHRLLLNVKRVDGKEYVIISKEEFDAMEETSYLLQSNANAKRLYEAIQRNPSERVSFNDVDDLKHEVEI